MAEGAPAVVGVVHALYRYPVKSMRGESLTESAVGWHGLPGDRRYAFVRMSRAADTVSAVGDSVHWNDDLSGFPWLTARQVPELLLYEPYLESPAAPKRSPIRVRTPEGDDLPVESLELRASLARRYSRPFHLLRLLVGTFDASPLSIITTGTIGSLGSALGMELQPERFRPNIVIATPLGDPAPEQSWVGHTLTFGDDETRVRVTEPDERCKMITLDPETAEAEPRVLDEVIRSREECAGVYASPDRLGTLRIGQTVRLA
jgi:uncharacterized protein